MPNQLELSTMQYYSTPIHYQNKRKYEYVDWAWYSASFQIWPNTLIILFCFQKDVKGGTCSILEKNPNSFMITLGWTDANRINMPYWNLDWMQTHNLQIRVPCCYRLIMQIHELSKCSLGLLVCWNQGIASHWDSPIFRIVVVQGYWSWFTSFSLPF